MSTFLSFSGRYGTALVAAGLAVLLQWLLQPFIGDHTFYIFLYPAVVIISLWLGMWPGVFTTLTGIIATDLWLISHVGRIDLTLSFIVRGITVMVVALFVGYVARRIDRDNKRSKYQAAALRESEENFRTFAEFTYNWEYWLSPERRLLYTSPSCEQITGYGRQAFMEDDSLLSRIVLTDDQPQWVAHVQESCARREVLHHEFRIVRRNGQIRWIGHVCRPVNDSGGKFRGWRVSNQDITDRKQYEECLRDADRRKNEYLGMLAHELRNPLAPIRNAVYLLHSLHPEDSNFLQRQRDVIERQVTHMARLLDDLLDISRITRGKIALHKQPIPVAEILDRSQEAMEQLFSARRQTLHLSPPPRGLSVEGDLERLVQVLGNLLSNAAKYTGEGGQIWLQAGLENGEAVIRVRDTGIGMTSEAIKSIFDIFFQVNPTLDRSQGGLGIGLTLVRSLVAMHGGTVEAHSPGPDQGSEFVVRLPALPESHVISEPVAKTTVKKPKKRNYRILVVDDIVDTSESLAEILRMWGHDVQTAPDGPSALKINRSFHPNIILLDIGLPGLDGYAVARSIKEESGQNVRVIAMTGYGQKTVLENAKQAGMDCLLVKPVDPAALQNLLTG